MSLAEIKKQYQDEIEEGIARTLWVMAYADWAGGDNDFEHEVDDLPGRAGPGEDWDDVAPETPDAAFLAARDLSKLIAKVEGVGKEKSPLAELFEIVMTVDQGVPFELYEEGGGDRDSKIRGKERATKLELAHQFGSCLAHMATGSGISWFDDHKLKSGGGDLSAFQNKMPVFECNYDGDELVWSGSAPDAEKKAHRASGQQQAEYEEGEIRPLEKLGRITFVNSADRDMWKHSYVLWFGAYGHTVLLAYANSLDVALDECIDWLVDNAPGHIVDDQVNEEYKRLVAEGMDDEKAQEQAEVDTTTGGNAGNHINSSEWGILAEDPDRDQLYEIAQVGQNPSKPAARGSAPCPLCGKPLVVTDAHRRVPMGRQVKATCAPCEVTAWLMEPSRELAAFSTKQRLTVRRVAR